eukprot:1162138-Pelagomonas_calceolata.AAC.8
MPLFPIQASGGWCLWSGAGHSMRFMCQALGSEGSTFHNLTNKQMSGILSQDEDLMFRFYPDMAPDQPRYRAVGLLQSLVLRITIVRVQHHAKLANNKASTSTLASLLSSGEGDSRLFEPMRLLFLN